MATVLLSAVLTVNGQFLHFPVQSGRPDSGQRTPPAAPAVPRTAARTLAEEADEDYNEVQTVPERLGRGRGRVRAPDVSPAPARSPVRRPEPVAQRRPVERRPQSPQQRRPQPALQRRPEIVPSRRPEPATNPTPSRQRIRIKTKRPETRTEETPVLRQRQRIQAPESSRAVVTTTTPPPPTPSPPSPPPPTTTPVTEDAKQTFGQSLSGMFDTDSITVFGVNRDQPRLLPQPPAQPQFKIPEVSVMRKLPEPRVINEVRDIPKFSNNVRKLPEPKIVQQNVQKKKQEPRLLVTPQPVRNLPLPEIKQALEKDQAFTFFPAKPQPTKIQPQPKEIPSQRVVQQPVQTRPPPVKARPSPVQTRPPPVQARPSPVQTRPPPVRAIPSPVQARPQPVPFKPLPQQPSLPAPLSTFQSQPEVSNTNFQARPVQPPVQRQPVQAIQDNFFQEGQPLFSQPIEIPSQPDGGASFSYEAIVG